MDALQERPYTVLDKRVPGPRSRLPNFDDRPRRLYLRPLNGIPRVTTGAMVGGAEAFCSGIPHHGVRDDLYKGFYIPGGKSQRRKVLGLF